MRRADVDRTRPSRVDGRDLDLEARHTKVTVGVASGSAFRERRIGQRFDAEPGDSLQRRVGRDGVRRQRGVVAGREHGTVRQCREHDAARRADVARRERCPGRLGRAHRQFPLRLGLTHFGSDGFQFAVGLVDVRLQPLARLLLVGRGQVEPRFGEPRPVAEGGAVVLGVREEGEQPVVVLLREGIVLVVVALRAGERRAEPDGGGRVRAIDENFVQRFLGIDAALFVGHRVAMEPARDFLIDGGVRQHVARDLLDRESIERQVAIEGVDDPVAVLPDRAAVVLFVSVRVGVPRQVQPGPRPPFAVVGRCEQSVDDPLVRAGRRVGQEGIDLVGCRRKAREIQRDAAKQRGFRRISRRRQAFALEPRQDEAVDRILRPAGVGDRRQVWSRWRDVGPVSVDRATPRPRSPWPGPPRASRRPDRSTPAATPASPRAADRGPSASCLRRRCRGCDGSDSCRRFFPAR